MADEDWEEWDGRTPFWHHCVAGSMAGVAEHALVYPLDTVRTHIQVCAACNFRKPAMGRMKAGGGGMPLSSKIPNNPTMWQTIRHLVSQPVAVATTAGSAATTAAAPTETVGFVRLWRGIQTVWMGCIPAHALYFSSYEAVKAATRDANGEVTTYGSVLSGAVAVFFHDSIMSPLDTVKQRLQLGHYHGSVTAAIRTVVQQEGWIALYRSFPVTLASNVPYGMVMVSTNEFCRKQFQREGDDKLTMRTTLLSSSIAGFCAAALTTPLDRIKTYLQTQKLAPTCYETVHTCRFDKMRARGPVVATWQQAAERIWIQEGPRGFVRGICPRILSHTPAVAISWTTYEFAKQYLAAHMS